MSDIESFNRKFEAQQVTQGEFVKMIELYIYVLDLCKYKFDVIPHFIFMYYNRMKLLLLLFL